MQLNIYIGFDSRNDGQQLAFDICKKSILQNTIHQDKITINGLVLKELEEKGFNREFDKLAATEFTYTRFMVPYLNNYQGIALFCDSDFLWECDVYQEMLPYIHNMLEKNASVCCVKHDYVEKNSLKMNNLYQSSYPRKNWSSLIIFNCSHNDCQNLTLENINQQTPAWLHRFGWAKDENMIEIPHTFNYLVEVYHDETHPKAIHYTNGGPWHYLYQKTEFYDKWLKYLDKNQLERLKKEIKRQEIEKLNLIFDKIKKKNILSDLGLIKLLKDCKFKTVLDIGSGEGVHANFMREADKIVDTVDYGTSAYANKRENEITYVGDFMELNFEKQYDCVFCSHIMEHQLNVNLFLKKINTLINENGYLLISVPPLRTKLVGGHINQFVPSGLFYHLVLAGFDCSNAMFKIYGYNQTVIVQKKSFTLPKDLCMDIGDIEKLSKYFPKSLKVKQGTEIKATSINWS